MKLLYIIIFISQSMLSQSEVSRLKQAAEDALEVNDIIKARHIYQKIVELSSDKDNWFNLATLEIQLQETESACKHLYQAHLRRDTEAMRLLKVYCPDFKSNIVRSLSEVDEMPKFIYKEKEYDLYKEALLHPKFIEIITKSLKKSRIISNVRGRMSVIIDFDSNGKFTGKIMLFEIRLKDIEVVKSEVRNIFNMVEYIPAKLNGEPVEIFEKGNWPIILN